MLGGGGQGWKFCRGNSSIYVEKKKRLARAFLILRDSTRGELLLELEVIHGWRLQIEILS